MRKISCALILIMSICVPCLSAEVNPDAETHRVIGGLYALVSAANMNGELNPSIGRIRKYFADIPSGWQEGISFSRVKNELWAGVTVGQYSSARQFLRSHPELGITDTPGGSPWMGGGSAWLKAADIVNGRLRPVKLMASRGSGTDSGAVFFSTQGQSTWWLSSPALTRKTSQEALKLWGVKQAGLRKPSGVSQSIYDEVRPSEVEKPGDIHTSRKKSFIDSLDMDMGDVIFRPIPNTSRIE